MNTAIHTLPRRMAIGLVLLSLVLLSLALPAGAQSPEDAILDGDPLNVGLQEKKAPVQQVLDDPNPKQIEGLNKQREAIEAFINSYQTKFTKERVLEIKLGKKLAKLAEGFDQLTADALKAGDNFALTHNPQIREYRSAIQEDRGPDVKKAAAAVEKTRKAYAATLAKLNKRMDKIKADFDKLEPELDADQGEGVKAEDE